jgi:hypothetical protein
VSWIFFYSTDFLFTSHALATIAAEVSFCENTLQGGGWQLVRRVRQGFVWHAANDNLTGTAEYGKHDSATSNSSFSIKFGHLLTSTTQMLFATGKARYEHRFD